MQFPPAKLALPEPMEKLWCSSGFVMGPLPSANNKFQSSDFNGQDALLSRGKYQQHLLELCKKMHS
jgi:hypothetical protein